MAHKVELARLSWQEVADIDKASAVLLLPIGVTEQHGPAGIMGTDYVLAERVAVEAASRLDGVYVAPTIAYGYSPTFQNFPGNLGLPFEVVKSHLSAVVERLIQVGWRKIIYVNGHQGNDPAIEQVSREMKASYGMVMAQLVPWRIAQHVSRDLYQNVKAAYGHGAEPTISVMMSLFPGDMPVEYLQAGKTRTLPGFESSTAKASVFRGLDVGLYVDTEFLTPSGASADPAEASPEKGEEILRRVVQYCVDYIPVYRSFVSSELATSHR